jgi:hypothetical protein
MVSVGSACKLGFGLEELEGVGICEGTDGEGECGEGEGVWENAEEGYVRNVTVGVGYGVGKESQWLVGAKRQNSLAQ